jgi:diacylglycerol kinase (ATP)
MRARLIANPGAGTDRAPVLLPLINEKLRTVFEDLDVTITTGGDDVEHAAARSARDGCDALFVAGGDGTLNRVLRGLLTAGGAIPRLPIGVIPAGTGNDFAKALGLGEDPDTALDGLVACRVIDVDVGTLNDVPFINTSAGGFVADVSDAVTEPLKDRAGKLAYLIGGARALLGSEPFSARVVTSEAPGVPPALAESRELRMFAVCNARFIGGGYPIAPGALIDDGMVDVLVVPQLPALEFIAALQRIAAGEEGDRSDLIQFRASAFDLVFSRTVKVNTDGEVLETDHARYRVHPRAARFFCGAAPHASGTPVPLGWR